MKKYLSLLLPAILIFNSCKNKHYKTEDSPSTEKKISRRDMSITPANAFNNLFLDSATVAQFIASNSLDEDIARRMTSYYNARNYQYSWFAPEGLTEQGRAFWNQFVYQSTYAPDSAMENKALQKQMSAIVLADDQRVSASDKNIQNAELNLTRYFIVYAKGHLEEGYLKRKEMERFVPRKKENAMMLADSLLTKKHKDNKYYEDVNPSYKALKAELLRYYNLAKAGGWPQINASAASLKKPDSALAVQLKRRLSLTGDMAADSIPSFDANLQNGIKNFQVRHGFAADGKLSEGLVKQMNVPVEQRLKQILINMNRMQWTIDRAEGRLIKVNIPEYKMHIEENNKEAWNMNVIVGKDGHNTTIFTGNLSTIVFSPYWNIPPSIVKKEILPAMEKNPNYLASHEMEITGNENGLPVIRRLPGEKNDLGRVKFLFPNSFNIYFHDTPVKTLFDKNMRAFSHGCIRLKEPAKLAEYLLKDDAEWDAVKIQEAMLSNNETFVKLKKPVPVVLMYYTAWVDESNKLHFAEDIYGHDEIFMKKFFL